MKIECLKENLNYALQNVQKAISNKRALPILEGILLETENNQLKITATDLELGIETKIPVKIFEEGKVVITSEKFIELVKKLPNTEIYLEKKDNNVKVKYLKSEIEIKGWDPEEYPVIPNIDKEYEFLLKNNSVLKIIKQTIFASSLDESRPNFNGALMEISNDNLKMITTDSHRLAVKLEKITTQLDDLKLIIPRKTLSELMKIIKDDDNKMEIYGNSRQICFELEDTKIISRVIDAQFPDYEQVLPKTFCTKLRVQTKDFLETIERANLFNDSQDKTSTIKFKITDGNINISSKSELGYADENLEAFVDGDNLEVSFNAKYLIDALKLIEAKDIIFNFSGSLSPGIIKEGTNDNFIYLVLPLRNN